MPVDVLHLNGTVGSGKSTVAEAVSALESRHGGVHALIDVDAVRGLRPPPPADPFQFAMQLENLRDLARNYRRAGAARLVVAGVIEHAADVARVSDALGARDMLVVRLTATPQALATRLAARHGDDPEGLARHLHRAPQLEAILTAAHADQVVLDTSDEQPDAVARRIRALAGW